MERGGTGRQPWRRRRYRSRWTITQRAVRADGVVMPSPGFDQDPGPGQGVENLSVQQFIAHRAFKGLAIVILLRTAGRDVERLYNDFSLPISPRTDSPCCLRTAAFEEIRDHSNVRYGAQSGRQRGRLTEILNDLSAHLYRL